MERSTSVAYSVSDNEGVEKLDVDGDDAAEDVDGAGGDAAVRRHRI